MKRLLSESFARQKRNFQLQDRRTTLWQIAKILVIVIAVLNLSYSQVHIAVITQIFNRVIGLVMFTFILFGLVSLFSVTRIAHTSLWAILSVLATNILGGLYVVILLLDVSNQVAVTMSTIMPSLLFSIVILLFNFVAIGLFIMGEFTREEA